jgi:hypothetical protein
MACDPRAISGGIDLSDACLELDVDWTAILGLAVALPGGIEIQAQIEPGEFPDLSKIVNDLLGKINTALTPLVPIFRLTDVIIALVDCVKAIPDALGPPPNPMPLIECAQKLLKAMGYVLQMLPQVSVPLLIQSLCNLLVSALSVVRDQLACMILFSTRLNTATARAEALSLEGFAGAIKLLEAITCSRVNLDNQLQGICVGTELLSALIRLINVFTGLIGLPEIPSPALLCEDSAALTEAIFAPIDEGIAMLRAICSAIPTVM